MEPIPARLLRPLATICASAPPPTEREKKTRAYILEAASNMFAKYGTNRITMRAFAEGASLSQSTIRRHVCDMHHLFRLVLTAHLDMILAGIGKVPLHHPDRRARCRAEYRRLTRDENNRLLPMQILLTRYRFALPPDQLEPLEDHRRAIGSILAGADWEMALDMLDSATITIDQVESALLAIHPPQPADRTETAPQPRPAHTQPMPTPNEPIPFRALMPTAPPPMPQPHAA
jgi:AcrR family transcriptional regulator